jgi:NitT/TauT family transport system ATP-binding protein
MELQINKVSKVFKNNGQPHQVLKDLSFTIGDGAFVTLLGPSGCGKTTLLNIIGGFLKATEGEIRLNGTPVKCPGPDRGFVFQDYALFPWLTVKENILYPLKEQKWSREERVKRLQQLLQLAHMEGKENLYPSQISGGMKQRIAVIRALAPIPKILLMDEPLGALDPHLRQKLQGELEALWIADSTTVIMVTHDVDEAVFLSDRVIVMSSENGRIVGDISIKLPRPRRNNRKSDAYKAYKKQLTELVHSDRSFQEEQDEAM